MSNAFVGIRNGGKTDEEGALTRLLNKLAGTQNSGKIGIGDVLVAQHSTPNMSVDIAVGDVVIPYLAYFFHGWITAIKIPTVSASDPTNGRIDRTVAYVDLTVISSTNSNNPDAILFKTVAGTPAGSPARPSDATVQASVGAGNPFIDLADLAIAHSVTTVVNANITDKRGLFQLGGGVGGIQFTLSGTVVVANNQTPVWIAPRAGSFSSIYAYIKTAPTGQSLNIRINKNGVSAATLNISAGAQTANSTGLSISFAAGDYFTIDITQVGSTILGADLTCAVG